MVYLTLFLSSFLAATIIPFGSEPVFLSLIDEHNVYGLIVFATIGNWLGGMVSFYMGWLAKWNWIEKYLRVKRDKVEGFRNTIDKYGAWMALLCWLPIIGDVIAIGLGVFRVSVYKTSIYMLFGKLFRYVFLAFFFL